MSTPSRSASALRRCLAASAFLVLISAPLPVAAAGAIHGTCLSASQVEPAGGNGWTLTPLEHYGPLAVTGDMTAHMFFLDSGLWQVSTTDGGNCWSEPTEIVDPGYVAGGTLGLAQRGQDLHLMVGASGSEELRYHRSHDGGATWEPATSIDLGSSFNAFGVDLAVDKTGDRIAFVFGGDEDMHAGVSTDGGDTWSPTQAVVDYVGDCCVSQPQVEFSGDVAIVTLWRTERRFVARRSTDGGQTWLPFQLVLKKRNNFDEGPNQLASRGAKVVSVLQAQNDVKSRISLDGGATWGKGPTLASDVGQVDIALEQLGRRWRLMYAANGELHYRQSRDGMTWSSDMLIDNSGFESVVDMGILDGHLVAPVVAFEDTRVGYWARKN